MPIYYYGDKISQNMTRTPEGFLICQNVPIARIGEQVYTAAELERYDQPGALITVKRTPEEVFALAAMASFEGKPVTNLHPPEDVTPETYNRYQCGHVQNVRRGADTFDGMLVADLYVTDPALINDIESGRKRMVSCGYSCNWNTLDDGMVVQQNIRGNHVAVVPEGRAGTAVAIHDSPQAPPAADNTPEKETHMSGETPKLTPVQRILKLFGVAMRDAKDPQEIAEVTDTAAAALQEIMADKPADATADTADTGDATADTGDAKDATGTADGATDTSDGTADADDAAKDAPGPDPEMLTKAIAAAIEPVMTSIKALGDRLGACEQKMADKADDTAQADEADEVDTLISELTGEEKAKEEIDPVENEESVTVEAETVDGQADSTADTQTRDAKVALLKALKPSIAAIKDADTRKSVTDALRAAFLPAGTSPVADIMKAQEEAARKAQDNAAQTDVAKQQAIYDQRNPHKATQ